MSSTNITRIPISRVNNPSSAEFLKDYGHPNKPVVITGCMTDWKAMTHWMPDALARRFGEVEVTVHRCRVISDVRRLTLGAYIEYLNRTDDDDPYYLGGWQFEFEIPQLLQHFTPPEYFNSWHPKLPTAIRPCWRWLYIGGARSGTPMHVDTWMTSAWNGVICGRKRWLFYSPEQRSMLYDGAAEPDTRPITSYPKTVDAFNPDFRRYPLFTSATAIECIQEPGDIVFTPSGWWHQVLNEETCVSITENFLNETNCHKVMASIERQGPILNKWMNLPANCDFVELMRQHIPDVKQRRQDPDLFAISGL